MHTQTDGEVVRGYFAGCWREQRESAEGGGEREQEKREGTQREERKCVIGGGSERGYHAEGRYGYQMQTEMCKEKKEVCS